MFWRSFLTGLKKRGLGGVKLVVSDQHAAWSPRCAGPSTARRTAGSTSPATARASAQDPRRHGRRGVLHRVRPARHGHHGRDLGGPRPAPKSGPLMDDAKTEVPAFSAFSPAHWSKVWSTNLSNA